MIAIVQYLLPPAVEILAEQYKHVAISHAFIM